MQACQLERTGKLVFGVGGQGKPLTNLLVASSPLILAKLVSVPEQGGGDPPKDIVVFPSETSAWICPGNAVLAAGSSPWCSQHPPCPQKVWFGGLWNQKIRVGWASAAKVSVPAALQGTSAGGTRGCHMRPSCPSAFKDWTSQLWTLPRDILLWGLGNAAEQ